MTTDYENREAMKALRGPVSRRATSSEFNEWMAREVCEYVDALKAELAEAKETIGELISGARQSGSWYAVDVYEDEMERARAFLNRSGK